MRKVQLIMEAANLAAYYAEPGIKKVVVIQDNNIIADAIILSSVMDAEYIREKIIFQLSTKLADVSEIEELEYMLAA